MKFGLTKKVSFLKTGTKLGTAKGGHGLVNLFAKGGLLAQAFSEQHQLGKPNAGIVRSRSSLTP